MVNDDFNNGETLRTEKAEHNDSIYTLRTLYKIFLWLPIVLISIGLIVDVCLIASINTIDDFTKIVYTIISIVVYLLILGLIIVFMAVTRLFIFHLERTDYNTRMLLELALELYKDKNTIEQKAKPSIENNNEEIFNDTIKGLDAMISSKIINDDQFNNHILALKKLGTFNNSDSLVN